MVTSLALVAVLACKPYTPPSSPPPVFTTAACEGSDLVRRNHDRLEVSRVPNACLTVRCEGTDRVRRNRWGSEVSRETNACTVVRCEGGDRVVRAYDGWEVSRVSMACMPRPTPPPAPTSDVFRFGLSYR
jgi:hypothetical protein